MAEFNATIMNPDVIKTLVQGQEYYVDFTEVPKAT